MRVWPVMAAGRVKPGRPGRHRLPVPGCLLADLGTCPCHGLVDCRTQDRLPPGQSVLQARYLSQSDQSIAVRLATDLDPSIRLAFAAPLGRPMPTVVFL